MSEQSRARPSRHPDPGTEGGAAPLARLWAFLHWGDAALDKEQRAAFVQQRLRVGGEALLPYSLVGAALFMAFLALDYAFYPDHIRVLAVARGLTTLAALLLAGVVWFSIRRGTIARHARVLTLLFALVFVGGLDVVIMHVGGLDTPYYAGMNLILLALSIGLPLQVWETALLLVFVVAQLNAVEFMFDDDIERSMLAPADFFMGATVVCGVIINWLAQKLRVEEFSARQETERLLLNILPHEIADELRAHKKVKVRSIDSCTILFTDFVGFTAMSAHVDPEVLVERLDEAFSAFDEICEKRGLERLKTIGDAYMCAAGVIGSQPDHLIASLLAGLQMMEALEGERLRAPDGTRWRMRLGVHAGAVVAGVIGTTKFAYDLWGDTVNTASRLESTGLPASINVAWELYEVVQRFFVGEDRGYVPVRGKGPMRMASVLRLRPEYSEDRHGRAPNARFGQEVGRWLAEGGATLPTLDEQRERPPIKALVPVGQDPTDTFATLAPGDQERLMDVADHIHVGQGKVLIEEGQGLSVLFLIVKGFFGVEVHRQGADIQVAVLGPGEIIGELSFVTLEPASATVVALSDATVMRFDLDRLQEADGELSGLGVRLLHSFAVVLARRVREANARIFSAGGGAESEAATEDLEPRPALLTPSLPVPLLERIRGLRLRLHPLAAGAEQGGDALGPEVDAACGALLDALEVAAAAPAGSLSGAALALRGEAAGFLGRSRLLGLLRPDGRFDHAALGAILADEPSSADPLGRLIDAWVLRQAYARAVRSGIELMAEQVRQAYRPTDHTWRMAVLDAGAASAALLAFGELQVRSNLQLTYVGGALADLSAVGVQAASMGLSHQIHLTCADVFARGPARTRHRMLPQQLVLLAQLPGAVDDAGIAEVLREVVALLVPGGTFLVGWIELPPPMALLHEHLLGAPVPAFDLARLRSLVAGAGLSSPVVELPAAEAGGGCFRCIALHRGAAPEPAVKA
ncbi:MAG: adenylate/guanylate cyclase domain-containing protein [Pseudomonadota bacterium]